MQQPDRERARTDGGVERANVVQEFNAAFGFAGRENGAQGFEFGLVKTVVGFDFLEQPADALFPCSSRGNEALFSFGS